MAVDSGDDRNLHRVKDCQRIAHTVGKTAAIALSRIMLKLAEIAAADKGAIPATRNYQGADMFIVAGFDHAGMECFHTGPVQGIEAIRTVYCQNSNTIVPDFQPHLIIGQSHVFQSLRERETGWPKFFKPAPLMKYNS